MKIKTIEDYFKATYSSIQSLKSVDENPIRKPIICMDGFTMSVQGSKIHHCTPRFIDTVFYQEYEIGYPSDVESSILEYAEDESSPTDTVYGWVPYEKIDAIIEKHGGFDLDKMNLYD